VHITEEACVTPSTWNDGGACYKNYQGADDVIDDDALVAKDCGSLVKKRTWVVGGYCNDGESMNIYDCVKITPGRVNIWTETGYCDDGTSRTKQDCITAGRWTEGTQETCKRIIRPEAGDRIVFMWKGKDSVYELSSRTAYDNCDFTVVSRDPKGITVPTSPPGERQDIVTNNGDALKLYSYYHSATTIKGIRIKTDPVRSEYLVDPTDPQNLATETAYPDPDQTDQKTLVNGKWEWTDAAKNDPDAMRDWNNAHTWRPITMPPTDGKMEPWVVGQETGTRNTPQDCSKKPWNCRYEMPADLSDGDLTVHFNRPGKEPWRPFQDTTYQSDRKQAALPYFDEKEHPGEPKGHGFHSCPPKYGCIWGRTSPAIMFIPSAGSPLAKPFQIYYLASVQNCHSGLKVIVEVNGAQRLASFSAVLACVWFGAAVLMAL
jgi:hypothetical protein